MCDVVGISPHIQVDGVHGCQRPCNRANCWAHLLALDAGHTLCEGISTRQHISMGLSCQLELLFTNVPKALVELVKRGHVDCGCK